MKEKIFSMHTTAVDKNGVEHIVVIAGVYNQYKTYETIEKDVKVPVNKTKEIDGILLFERPQIKRNLRYAFAICHPDDKFDIKVGEKLAVKRAKKSPLGEMETTLITTLCKDQVKLILYGEMMHVVNNIDKYIACNKDNYM